jgi:hypothetical protein
MWKAYHWYRRLIDMGLFLSCLVIAVAMGVLVAIWWQIP